MQNNSLINFFSISFKRLGLVLPSLFFLTLSSAIFEMIGFSMIIPMFDILIEENASKNQITEFISKFFLFFKIPLSIENILILIILIFLSKSVLVFITESLQASIITSINRDLQLKVSNLIENVNFKFLTQERTGKFTNLLSRECNRYSNSIKNLCSLIVQILPSIVFLLTIIILYPSILLITIIFFCSSIIIIFPLLNLTKTYSFKTTKEYSETQSNLLELVNNYVYLKATNLSKKFKAIIKQKLIKLRLLTFKSELISLSFATIKEPAGVLIISVIIYMKVVQDGQPLQDVIFVSLILYKIIHRLIDIFNLWQRINMDIGGFFEVENALSRLTKNQEKLDGGKNIEINNSISFKNVSFKYGKEKLLNNVSFQILPLKSTAIVGPSGSGKSTLIYLLTKLIKPSNGKIFVGNENLNNISSSFYREQIGYVNQDVSLFYGTLKENISFWNRDGLDNKVLNKKILKLLKISDSTGLFKRLNDHIGETGKKLSGGQKQKITIARELFKDPGLIIFDEATSSMDSFSEEILQQSLLNIKNKTTVIISHRISTIKKCDNIIVLNNGRVVQQGKFTKLWNNKKGLFRQLCEKQNLT